jgi:hypothetical protein
MGLRTSDAETRPVVESIVAWWNAVASTGEHDPTDRE